MGYIKEPEGVDLTIDGGALSREDAKRVSAAILRYKKIPKAPKAARVRQFVPLRRKKKLA